MRRKKTLTMLGAVVAAASPMPASKALASGGGEAGGDLHLVAMDPVAVPIIDADRMSGTLNFKLVVDVDSAAGAERITGSMPVLRAAVVAAGVEFARLDASSLRAVNVAALDHSLTEAIKAVEPDVKRVLIVEVGASMS
ncbi:hypothetical protein ACX40Y_16745 [Sphingomonas sp. RS6]